MALVLADRVQETSTTSGTGTFTLAGAVSGFKTFSSAVGNTNTTYYVAYDQTAYLWEVGIGTVGAGTLSRDTVLSNSSGTTAKISFVGNQLNVWCDYPAGKAVIQDADNNGFAPQLMATNGLLITNATINTSTSIPSGYNAISPGPQSVASGVTVTVPSGSVWTVV